MLATSSFKNFKELSTCISIVASQCPYGKADVGFTFFTLTVTD